MGQQSLCSSHILEQPLGWIPVCMSFHWLFAQVGTCTCEAREVKKVKPCNSCVRQQVLKHYGSQPWVSTVCLHSIHIQLLCETAGPETLLKPALGEYSQFPLHSHPTPVWDSRSWNTTGTSPGWVQSAYTPFTLTNLGEYSQLPLHSHPTPVWDSRSWNTTGTSPWWVQSTSTPFTLTNLGEYSQLPLHLHALPWVSTVCLHFIHMQLLCETTRTETLREPALCEYSQLPFHSHTTLDECSQLPFHSLSKHWMSTVSFHSIQTQPWVSTDSFVVIHAHKSVSVEPASTPFMDNWISTVCFHSIHDYNSGSMRSASTPFNITLGKYSQLSHHSHKQWSSSDQ